MNSKKGVEEVCMTRHACGWRHVGVLFVSWCSEHLLAVLCDEGNH